jgi:ParB family chromosome partitioning protein
MKSSAGRVSLTAYEDLFKTDEGRAEEQAERIMAVPLSELHSPEQHPFRVIDDDSMKEMADSITKYGVMTPAIARPREQGGYELIAGNRRKRACELAEINTMPVIIREMDDDAAIILMVDSNMQRENILPSEKAMAYKMKLDAIKRQGARTDLTSVQVGQKLKGTVARDLIAEKSPDSSVQIQRYIRLTNLSPQLLDKVDNKQIPLNPAVEISYLSEKEQTQLLETMERNEVVPSLSQAQRLKKYSQEGKLGENVIDAILTEEKAIETKVVLRGDTLHKYFPKGYTPKQMEDTIIKLLDNWQRHRQQEQNAR